MTTENRSKSVSPFLLLCVFTSVLSPFQFGYHAGVINQPREAMHTAIPMDDWQWGFFVSAFLLGGTIGGLTGGHLSSAFGRRRSMVYGNILFALGTLSISFAQTVLALYAGRVLAGVASGWATAIVPIYINEISPKAQKGILGSMNQLGIVLGILVSVLVGLGLATIDGWRYMFGLALLPCVLQWVLLPMCVESPAWLASRRLSRDSREALERLYGVSRTSTDDDSTTSLNQRRQSDESIEVGGDQDFYDDEDANAQSPDSLLAPPLTSTTSSSQLHSPPSMSFIQMVTAPELRRPLLCAVGIHVTQQFSGINAAMFYSTTIFIQNYKRETAIYLTVLISVVNTIMTLLSTALIDKLGRRPLLLVSELGMGLCSVGIFAAASVEGVNPAAIVALLMAFVGMFAVGLGGIPWIILPELIPSHALSLAASLGTGVNWGCAFLLAFIFPAAVDALGYSVFLVFATFLALAFTLTYTFIPETSRGRATHSVRL
ncbi:major facilitator superfamily domain-containing protein [Fimicolochytrium jonesii]|uniref:major facilitator superfamily domain-containing protein n=1 Tax=Fimicolochytrium jonesii TaxID=1396493 RepID=UPI0022FDDA0E|nr:major facilitator superfamily domain-containing protein [Fimicolochytrium jonesii]KAI8822948.1 major facilitator superfamily domain-containing protein [Fimicolochytrium jonesii]